MILPNLRGPARPVKPVSAITLAFLFGLFLLSSGTITAQEPQGEDVITSRTTLVQLNVGVVDAQGRPITSLGQNDFAVFEDNVRQTITSFEPVDSPFSLVLLLDVSGSTLSFRPTLKQSALRFIDALGPDDRISVVQFNDKVETLAPFTSNRKKIAYAIDIAQGKGQTALYKALSYSLSQLAKERTRRKAVVVLTDGLDTEMRNADRALAANAQTDAEAINSIKPNASGTLNSVLNAADRQGVTIYPLALPSGDPKRLPLPDPKIIAIYTSARTRLQTLADRTGGRLNDIRRLEDVGRIYASVAADLRTLYSIAYQPKSENSPPPSGVWRSIRIEVDRPELIARTRPGYFTR